MPRYGLRATTNGSGSRICCRGGSGMLASPLKTTAASSRRSSIATVPEFRGVTSRNALGTGKTFTDGSAAGRRPECGNGCLSTSPARPTTNTPCSTARSCGRTSTAPALPKKDEDQAIGKSRGGLSTKIHALVDALGNLLTPGQTHDLVGADALLPQMAADTLIADKAFDADARVREPLAAAGKSAVIPPRPNRLTPPILTEISIKRGTSSKISSANSNSSEPSPPATTKPPEISSRPSTSRPLPFGSIDDTP